MFRSGVHLQVVFNESDDAFQVITGTSVTKEDSKLSVGKSEKNLLEQK